MRKVATIKKTKKKPATERSKATRKKARAGGRYTVVYQRDEDGIWVASVRGVKGCHTQGRSIAQARRRIRQALALWVDDAATAELVDDVRVPGRARSALQRLERERQRAAAVQAAAQQSTRDAARELLQVVSVRDAGELLGLSRSRVQQLVQN